MILKPENALKKKRWVFKIDQLGLDPFKFPDETSKEYDDANSKVYNLVSPNIIVSEEIDKEGRRKFALFDNYVQVYRLWEMQTREGSTPHLYELCPYYMKIHFDIDVSRDNFEEASCSFDDMNEMKYTLILEPYLNAIQRKFSEMFPLNYVRESFHRNILVFEAHRENKISFHIIIDGFYLSCRECFIFYEGVCKELLERNMELQSKMADFSVYKKNQSFRMMGCNKVSSNGKNGIKNIYNGPRIQLETGDGFSRETMIKTSFTNEPYRKEVEFIRVFERSLISTTMGCIRLTLNTNSISEKSVKNLKELNPEYSESEAPIEKETVESIITLFFKSPHSMNEKGEKAFVYDKVARGNFICVRRIKENHCIICERKHTSENGWLKSSPTGDVYFHCRRSTGKGINRFYIGNYCP
jgi:hypothetical protein